MTTPLTRLSEIQARADAAHVEICQLAEGKRKWTMCVPHQQNDSDFVLQAPLDDIPTLIAACKTLSEALEKFANRGAGPLAHRLEASEALEKAERILGGEKNG